MGLMDRRTFVQLSTAAMMAAASRGLMGEGVAPVITSAGKLVKVVGGNYSWEYLQDEDRFRLSDAKGRLIASSVMQPAVVVAPASDADARSCAAGKVAGVKVNGNRVEIAYEGVNGGARVSVSWRFDVHGVWLEPVVYEGHAAEDVVSLHYFTDSKSGRREPSLHASFLVLPGISEGPGVSPIVREDVHLK